jgi:saposin
MCEKAYLDILTPKAADEECTLCEMFISKLDATIEDKSNVEEIKEAVEKICTVLPSSVTRKCKKYVEEYGDLIINLIAQGIDPEQARICYFESRKKITKNSLLQVCTQLGLCDNVIVTPTKSDQKCTLCEMLISKLDATIEDKSNEEELKKYFENICSYMPSSVAPSCKKYVEEYGDAVIDMIAQGLDPEQASNTYWMQM